ncbi:hypothetical protein TRFO_21150 [Tritrichomonas foetus]|uniref:Actin n=1 Tax=Tritrichomonas foetus TaxID=1144522 RepID=A0A1J4KKB8_9EUKA|nr:hypothetical protein TRFO_21150 [Tritrichomonas foetus]|eukprot:OHT09797.1 hypothetical protein TRFO_21150 [Tritrichomonas foetus]
MVSNAPLTSTEDRVHLCDVLFNKLGASHVFLADAAVLTSYVNGRLTSLVIEFGQETVYLVPVVNGYAKAERIVRIENSDPKTLIGSSELADAIVKVANGESELITSIVLGGTPAETADARKKIEESLNGKVEGAKAYSTLAAGTSAFCGGSLLACMKEFPAMRLTKEEFEGKRDEVVSKKFFP